MIALVGQAGFLSQINLQNQIKTLSYHYQREHFPEKNNLWKEAEFKEFKTWLKHGWFHLKLHSFRCSTVTGFWVAAQRRGFNSLKSASVMIIFLRPPRLTCHFAEGFKGRVLIDLFFVIIEYVNTQETQQQKHT